jgi:acyl carrier protein
VTEFLTYDTVLDAVIASLVKFGADGVEITAETPLWPFDDSVEDALGLDSLDMLEVVFELEDSLALTFPESEAASIYTVGDLARVLARTEAVVANRV